MSENAFLPPASQGWGKVNVFCQFTSQGGGHTPVRFPFPSPDTGARYFLRDCPTLRSHVPSRGYPNIWSHAPSGRGYSSPGQGQYPSPVGGTPVLAGDTRTGVPPSARDRLRCGRYASCGFPQEDFLVAKSEQALLFNAVLRHLSTEFKLSVSMIRLMNFQQMSEMFHHSNKTCVVINKCRSTYMKKLKFLSAEQCNKNSGFC